MSRFMRRVRRTGRVYPEGADLWVAVLGDLPDTSLCSTEGENIVATNPEEHEYQLIEESLARAKTSKEIWETSRMEIDDARDVLESAKEHIGQSRALLDGKARPSTEGDDTTQIEK